MLLTSPTSIEKTKKTKYEMSLAEFPFAFLTKHIPKDQKSIVYEDKIKGRDGRPVRRRWEVTPHATLGFPTSSTQSTLFELFQIWAEQGFESQHIMFGSLYELIKRKGIKHDDGKAYSRIKDDLDRLVGVTIRAKNAFWDNEVGAYVTETFHLFERVKIYHSDPNNPLQSVLPLSHITASQTLWHSINANALIALKDVDRELYHSMKPTEQRLAVYLAKMLSRKTLHRRKVQDLANQLPIITTRYKDTKKMISRACDGLIKKKYPYLSTYRFEKGRQPRQENIVFRSRRKPSEASRAQLSPRQQDLVEQIHELMDDSSDRTKSNSFYSLVVSKLHPTIIYRAISMTRQAYLQGEVKTTRARYFTDVIKRLAQEQNASL